MLEAGIVLVPREQFHSVIRDPAERWTRNPVQLVLHGGTRVTYPIRPAVAHSRRTYAAGGHSNSCTFFVFDERGTQSHQEPKKSQIGKWRPRQDSNLRPLV